MLTLNFQDAPGKKRPSPPAQNMAEPFCFVPVTQGDASKGRTAAKRIVRAHVTRMQHAKSNTFNGMDLQSWTVNPHVQSESIPSVRRKPRKIAQCVSKPRDRTKNLQRSVSEEKSSTSASSGSSSSELVLSTQIDNAAADPFFTFPMDYHPEISPIIAHCGSTSRNQ